MNISTRSKFAALRGTNNEGVLALMLILLVATMTAVNPEFFSVETLFTVLRSSIVPIVLALGVLIVIIAGGIDVSFPAIAIFSAYTSVVIAQWLPGISVLAIVFLATLIGAVLGLMNGLLVGHFKLPTLIVTLGTQGIFSGLLLAYVGSEYIARLPESLGRFSTVQLFSTSESSLHALLIPAVLACLLVHLMLNRTMFGRGIYAIGDDGEAARRAGFSVVKIQIALFVLVGALAAFGGLLHTTLVRSANPQDLLGTELDIIAAVVLGGASIFGGRGSVLGTTLGVILIQVINNSLILMGIPSTWQRAVIGALLVIGVSAQAISARRSAKRTFVSTGSVKQS